MELERIPEQLNLFDKKKTLFKDFKQKLVDFKNLNNKFRRWDYIIAEKDIKDKVGNYAAIFFMTMFLSIPLLVLIALSKMPFLNLMLLLATNSGITYSLRNLKFGIFKNRYKKWQIIRSDINNIMNNSDNVCSLLLEVELNLKSFKQSLNEKEELEQVLDSSIEKLVKNMKNTFATYEGKTDDILQLLKNIEGIEKYETEINNAIKNYQLNKTYYDYKKTNGIIEEKEEKDSIEKTLITDFKYLL